MQMINEEDLDNQHSFHWYRDFFKRLFDIVISLIAVILLAIPMLFIAIWIKLDSPNEPVLFKQTNTDWEK